jgi:SulP family sulfate permease
MSGKQILGLLDWGQLLTRDSAVLLAPGLGLGVALIFITARFRHFAVLPCCLIAIPVVFHCVLLAAGISLDEARTAFDHGWLAQTSGTTDFWKVYEHYRFERVDWTVLPK